MTNTTLRSYPGTQHSSRRIGGTPTLAMAAMVAMAHGTLVSQAGKDRIESIASSSGSPRTQWHAREGGDGVDGAIHGAIEHGGDGGCREEEGGFRPTLVERHGANGQGGGTGARRTRWHSQLGRRRLASSGGERRSEVQRRWRRGRKKRRWRPVLDLINKAEQLEGDT
jgi:hypothetical protein